MRVSPAQFQPIASDDVALALADVTGSAGQRHGRDRRTRSAWPLVQRYLKAVGDPRDVMADAKALYFGVQLDDRSLTPGDKPELGAIDFDTWIAEAVSSARDSAKLGMRRGVIRRYKQLHPTPKNGMQNVLITTDGRPTADVERQLRRYLPGLDTEAVSRGPTRAVAAGAAGARLEDRIPVDRCRPAAGGAGSRGSTRSMTRPPRNWWPCGTPRYLPARAAAAAPRRRRSTGIWKNPAWTLVGGPDSIAWGKVKVVRSTPATPNIRRSAFRRDLDRPGPRRSSSSAARQRGVDGGGRTRRGPRQPGRPERQPRHPHRRHDLRTCTRRCRQRVLRCRTQGAAGAGTHHRHGLGQPPPARIPRRRAAPRRRRRRKV